MINSQMIMTTNKNQ